MSTTYTTEKQNKFEVHVQSENQESSSIVLRGFILDTKTRETWFLKVVKKQNIRS